MKRILAPTLIALTFTVMFSSTSFAGWTKVVENDNGSTFYVDFERIRKHGGYVYFWTLRDGLKPNEHGNFSGKNYNQGDCSLFRYKRLVYVLHKLPMGSDVGEVHESPNKGWRYPTPNSVNEVMLQEVCSR